MEKLDGRSKDLEQTEREKLASVFPQCFVEGKLDIDKLLSLCGEYILKDFEKYEFTWKGKSECLRLAQQRSTATLRPCPEESVNFDTTQNLYIEGDNLEVLKLLQASYFRQVKMIYIDPPYNTGNDFVYKDDFKDPLERYREVTSQTTKSNPEAMGRFHTNWLNMMYPRLRLAANLLRDDGVIFISIDDHEVHNLRKICDEVFGEENFVAMFTWRTDGNFDNQAKIKICHQYIVLYAKSLINFPAPPVIDPSIPSTSKLFNDTIRNTIIKNGPKNPLSELMIPVGFPCDFDKGKIGVKDVVWPKYNKDIIVDNFQVVNKVIARSGWSSKAQIEEFIKNGFKAVLDTKGQATRFVLTSTGAIESIKNRHEFQSHVISVLANLGGTQKANAELEELAPMFDFPKPSELIKYLVKMNHGNEFTVLDFFSGSATTAHAVMQLNAEDGGNRRFIMVQLPELCPESSEAFKAGYRNICEIGKERIRRAGAKILEDIKPAQHEKQMTKHAEQLSFVPAGEEASGNSPLPDTGFKVFKLDTSNLKTWDSTPFPEDDLLSISNRLHNMIDRIKPDRTDLDVVYEIMLKMGVPLTYNVSPVDISGKIAWSVGDFLLLICLSDGLTVEMVEEMAEYAPGQIVLAENSLADDTAMSNAFYILRDRNIELKLV